MNYLSVCSGIEAASQAFTAYGWEPLWFSEIEPFPCRYLARTYPNVPNKGDMTKFQEWPNADVDVLCGGTPCQSFSVAGLRQGLADPRGNLMLTYGAIAARYRPRWLVWENVPGVLSSNGGRDFAAFLSLLGQLGYGWAYRVLDAQHVRTRRFRKAVPQRRRRVFVVGYLGDWRRAAAVLFDRESLSGHPAPRREAGKGAARDFEVGPAGGSLTDLSPTLDTRCKDGPIRNQLGVGVMCANSGDIGYCLTASAQQSLDAEAETLIAVSHALRGEGFDASEDGPVRGTPIIPVAAGFDLAQITSAANRTRVSPDLPASTLASGGDMCVAYRIAGDGAAYEEGLIAAPLTTGTDRSASPTGGGRAQERNIALPWAVRRLTPRECERLQGFPDDATDIPNGNKPAADGPRYKAIGNSWAVNCADWIAERITEVDRWP